MKQTWENDNKPNFGLGFGLFDPNMDPPKFFLRVLPLLVDIVLSYRPIQFKGKIINQT